MISRVARSRPMAPGASVFFIFSFIDTLFYVVNTYYT